MPNLIPFDVDLALHEGTRLAAVLGALGSHWDPGEIHRGEAEAHRMLYSQLDTDQQDSYRMLVAGGVLPDASGWSR